MASLGGGPATEVEAVGIVELLGIAVGRDDPEDQRRVGRDRDVVPHDFLGVVAG
ncbi:MAG: hypothetical protein ABWZ15_07685 [Acidimicrobiia bacterium]